MYIHIHKLVKKTGLWINKTHKETMEMYYNSKYNQDKYFFACRRMSITFYQNQPHPYIFLHSSYIYYLIFLQLLITRNNLVQNIYFA